MMTKMNVLAPPAAVLAATLMLSGFAQAQPVEAPSPVTVTIGTNLQREVEKLGEREVQAQITTLQSEVAEALTQRYPGATAELELLDLKPNRPTMQQMRDRPGLDPIRSVSVGGATVRGNIVTADGQRRPIEFSYFSPTIRDVWGFAVWTDADRAFRRLGDQIERGRY